MLFKQKILLSQAFKRGQDRLQSGTQSSLPYFLTANMEAEIQKRKKRRREEEKSEAKRS